MLEQKAEPPSAAAEPRWRRRAATWSLASGLALGAGFATVGIWNQSRYDRWDREQQAILKDAATPGVSNTDLVARQNANDRALRSVRTADAFTVGLGTATAVALVAALALLLWK
jgi:hypothetical protein